MGTSTANLADQIDIRVMDLTRFDTVRGTALATLTESTQHLVPAGFSRGDIVALEIISLVGEVFQLKTGEVSACSLGISYSFCLRICLLTSLLCANILYIY